MAESVSLSRLMARRSRGTQELAVDPSLLELGQFLFDYVESYEELQVLACLGVGRELWWEPDDVTRDCGVEPMGTRVALQRLTDSGLLMKQGSESNFKYRLHDDFKDRSYLFDRLAIEYRQNRLQLIEMMTRNAIERVRASALRTFAECFRIRGPKDDG